jgi:hypothetical protein
MRRPLDSGVALAARIAYLNVLRSAEGRHVPPRLAYKVADV